MRNASSLFQMRSSPWSRQEVPNKLATKNPSAGAAGYRALNSRADKIAEARRHALAVQPTPPGFVTPTKGRGTPDERAQVLMVDAILKNLKPPEPPVQLDDPMGKWSTVGTVFTLSVAGLVVLASVCVVVSQI